MAKAVQLPDGSWFPLKDGEDPLAALAEAEKKYPEAFGITTEAAPAKKAGIAGGFGRGIESLLSSYQTAAGAVTAPEEAAKAALQRQQKIGEKYEDAASLERVKKAYEEQGLWSAAKEVASQVPPAIAEQLPQLGTMFGGARLGAMAGSPFGPVGTVIGGIGGAGAALLPQFFGSNIERQAAEQQQKGEALQVDRGAALASATGQAALEAAGSAFVFGGRLVSKLTGIPEKALLVGSKPAEKLAEEKLRSLVAKGMARGFIAELPVEIGQQMLERAQAGLSLADEDAMTEYGQTAYQVGLLSPLGIVGRASERSGARQQVEQKRKEEAAAAAEVQAKEAARQEAEQAQYRQTPEYITDVQARYDALVKQEQDLVAKTKVKPAGQDPASLLVAKQEKEAAQRELKDFRTSPEYESLVQEYAQVLPAVQQQKQSAQATEAIFGKEPTYEAEDVSDIGQATALQKQIDALKKQQKGLPPAQQQPLQNRINAIEETLYGKDDKPGLVPPAPVYNAAKARLEQALEAKGEEIQQAATGSAQEQKLLNEHQQIADALAKLEQFKPLIKPVSTAPSAAALREKINKAKELGDFALVKTLVPKLAEAEQQGALPFETGYPVSEADQQLAAEIAQGREDATKRRAAIETETEALFRIGTKKVSPFALQLRKQRLDEARELMRQVSKPTAERLRLVKPYLVQPGGKLNQATRASLLVRENEQDWASFDKEVKENAFRVEDREQLRDQLKKKLRELEAEYNEQAKYGPSKAMDLINTEKSAVETALAQVERKLKIGRDRAITEPTADDLILNAQDQRVADLIDRLLPLATGAKPRTPEEAQTAEERQRKQELSQASLFDVEAQKELAGMEFTPATAKPAAQRVSQAPIEQAADLVERARELRDRLKEYNAAIQKSGRPSDPEKLARLNDLKDLRDSTLTELDNVQEQYAALTQRQTPAYQVAETEPGTADLFGGLEETRAEKNRVQARLDRLYDEREQLKADLQRRGQVGTTPELQALVEQYSKDTPQLRNVEDQIVQQEQELARISGKNSERFDAFIQAREAERIAEEDTKTRTLPGFERRAGVRPVDTAQLREAKTELVNLQNTAEELRRAQASGAADPTGYLRELAGRLTDEYEASLVETQNPIIKTWPIQKLTALSKRYPRRILEPTERDIEHQESLRKRIAYYNNVIKGRNRKALDTALDKNLEQQAKAREKIAALESRQRAYEQQEAVREGAAPGTAEAQRILEGEGFRTVSGAVRTKPKKLASWGITQITKKTVAPVTPEKIQHSVQKLTEYKKAAEQETKLAAEGKQTIERQIAQTNKNVAVLSDVLKQVYPTTVQQNTENEIEKLLATGLTPEQQQQIQNIPQIYAALKTTTQGNTVADVVARLTAEKDRLMAEKGRFTGRRGAVVLYRNEVEEELAGIKATHKKKATAIINEQIADLTRTIAFALRESKKGGDAWSTSFNSLIKETNAKALLASQELSFAQLEFNIVDRDIQAYKENLFNTIQTLRKKIAKMEKAGKPIFPDTTEKVQLDKAEEKWSRIGQDLPIDDKEYDTLLQARTNAAQETEAKQFAYKKARIEQLNLLKTYGNDLQTTLKTEQDKLATLATQAAEQTKDLKAKETQLKKIAQVQAKAAIAAKAKKEAPLKDELAEFKYTAKEKETLRRVREGLGLPGVRYEYDTTSKLVTQTRAAVRQTLTLRQAELEKAQAAGDVAKTQELTAVVQQLERDYESVASLGERVGRFVGEGAEEREFIKDVQPAVEPGKRLPTRIVGPLVRVGTQPPSQMLSGTAESREAVSKGNRPQQAGKRKLTAEHMKPADASAISLTVLKQQADASSGQRKKDLDAAFKAATDGMTKTQVAEKIKDGEDLIAVPGAASVVAARERYRVAEIAVAQAEADLKAAKDGYAKEMAQDSLDLAREESDRAYERLQDAKALVAVGLSENATAKKQTENAINTAFEKEAAKGEKEGPLTTAQRAAKAAEDDEFAVEYTTANRTESSAAVREAILDGRLVEALERLAVDSDNALIRDSAKDLSKLVLRTKLAFDPDLMHDGKPVPAKYSTTNNTITFRPEELTDEDIIHEATHAATLRVLNMPDEQLTTRQRNAKRELTAIYTTASKRRDLKTQYGIKDVAEFASELQSNVEFRAALDTQPWYKRVWHALTRLWSTKPIEKISDQASALVKEIYLPSAKIAAGPEQASIFRRETPPASSIIGYDPGKLETLRGNLFGLSGRVQYIDRLAAAEEALVKGEGAGKLSSTEAFNAQYFMRLADKVTQAAGQFITTGPVRIVADKVGNATEYRYESISGANLVDMSTEIELAAKAGGMSPTEAEAMLTVIIAGQRANAVQNGWERLQGANPAAAKAEYTAYVNKMNANPKVKAHMEEAMRIYKEYNEGQLNFAAQAGYLSKDEVRRLNKMPYVPFYRVEDGNVKLFVLGERPITIGNIKNSPDLAQFLGSEQKIQPILTSAVQNTFMLTRMAMHNKATMETSNALYKAGFVSKMGKGTGPESTSTVRYKIDGEDHFALVDADTFGIPAELIVRGMEGIKTTIPDIVKMMGIPANLLRKFITRSPAYAVRQLIKEPMQAYIISDVDGVPVANALKQLAKMRAGRSSAEQDLMRGLVVSSNIYTGDEQDMQKFLSDISAGRSGWDKFLGKMDTLALQADAATRAVIYEDSLKKGFSKAKAQFRAMESANFSRRGLSPSMQMMSTLVPFFNAQIQGLDVLYRSLTNKMPFAEQLEIQRKIVARGTMLFAGAMAYALMMQDDEAYKKAKPEERYTNFFVRIPGVKDPLKIPVPFEVGLFFMGVPQMLVDVATGSVTGKEATKAIGKGLLNSLPGVIPAAPKPIIEAFYGETAFGPIESQREKMLEAGYRFRPETTEAAKALGSFTGAVGVSPLMIEHFVRGYTGSLGLALLSTLNPLLRESAEGEKAPTGASKLPFVGGLFQPAEGRFLIDRAYSRMDDVIQAQQTYKDMVARGQKDRAFAYAKENADLLAGAQAAGAFRQRMGEFFALERKIAANPNMTAEEKEAKIKQLKAAENAYAARFYAATDRTTRP